MFTSTPHTKLISSAGEVDEIALLQHLLLVIVISQSSDVIECIHNQTIVLLDSSQVRWDRELYMNQLTCMSKAMAYVQKSSEKAINQLYCHNSDIQAHKMYNPLTFQEFYHLFLYVANTINKQAQVCMLP